MAEIQDCVNTYKHIVTTVNGFSQQIIDFADNPEQLETLISIVSDLISITINLIIRHIRLANRLAKRARATRASLSMTGSHIFRSTPMPTWLFRISSNVPQRPTVASVIRWLRGCYVPDIFLRNLTITPCKIYIISTASRCFIWTPAESSRKSWMVGLRSGRVIGLHSCMPIMFMTRTSRMRAFFVVFFSFEYAYQLYSSSLLISGPGHQAYIHRPIFSTTNHTRWEEYLGS
jgi:hypothetical protein